MLTATRLREVLDYDAETGVLRAKIARHGGVKTGSIVGTLTSRGYRHARVDGKIYQTHRLVWLYAYGRWPAHGIDHINGIHDDNRLLNLREATHTENMRNRKPQNSVAGLKGVYKKGNRWRAQIRAKGQNNYLGSFASAEEAHAVYCEAARKYHGAFAKF